MRRPPSPPGSPPALAERLLGWSCPAADRAAMLGDLAEEYATHLAPSLGRRRARRWYWAQALRSLPPNARRRLAERARRPIAPHPGDGIVRTLWQDLRYARRTLARNAAFTALAVLTLALGIGATTIVYSIVDGVVLNPFPYPEPKRLVGIGIALPKLDQELNFFEALSPAEFQDVATGSRTLERVVAWDLGNRQLAAGDMPERVFTAFWWGDALRTLEMRPHLGRGFLPEETATGARVAVVSHRLWLRLFAGDSSVIGRAVSVNGEPYTLVGVMPPRTLVLGTDLWMPMAAQPDDFPRGGRQFQILARLAPGATLAQANEELAVIARRVERDHGAAHEEYAGWRLEAQTWNDVNVRSVRPAALVLAGAVGFVLLLVVVNVASLLLARAAGRQREIAVRAALGAGRARLVRLMLTESLLLAAAGGALGAALAWAGTRTLAGMLASIALPVPGEVTINARVLLAAAGVSLLAGVLVGLVPALHAVRRDLQGALKREGAGGRGSPRRLQHLFVGVEVAFAVVLLTGGGLLVHSFVQLQRVDPGFDTRNLLTMRLTLPRERYDGPAMGAFFQTLTERVGALPGVRTAAAGTQFPPTTFGRIRVAVEGERARDEGALPTPFVTLASDGYFAALGLPVLRGRVPDARDTEATPRVVAINEAAARRLFPGRDPIGRRLRVGGGDGEEGLLAEVVGIVGSARNAGLERAPEPELFGSMRQHPGADNQIFLLVRTTVPPRSLLPAVRAQVRALDADQPIYAVQTVDEAFATAVLPRRLATVMLTLFGAFALALAAGGVFGVVSYAVSERTREIGVRMALGAGAGEVRRLMVRRALAPAAIGAGVGLLLALALGGVMRGLLFGVGRADPLTLVGATALLGGVVALAGWIPARRATRLDPVRALRAE